MTIDTSRKVLFQLIGKADGTPTQEDFANPVEAIDRIGGSMFAQAKAAFAELGVEPTECGGGLGEWDCGAFVRADELPALVVALSDRFKAAFRAHHLRWHIAVIEPHTDVFQKKH